MVRFLVLFAALIGLSQPTFASLKISVVPYKIIGAQSFDVLQANIEKIATDTAQSGAELLVLPELMSFDLLPGLDGEALKQQLKQDAAHFDRYSLLISNLARQHKIAILGGSFQRVVDNKIYNTAIFAHSDGTVILQDKLFLTPWERQQGWSDGEVLKVIEYKGIRLVILTCHDAEFPLISERIAKVRPELILVPSMTDDQTGHARVLRTSMARAIEHMSYVVVVGTTSLAGAPWHTYYGNAAILTPQSYYFRNMEKHAEVGADRASIFELDFSALASARSSQTQVYPARDQNQRTLPLLIESAQ